MSQQSLCFVNPISLRKQRARVQKFQKETKFTHFLFHATFSVFVFCKVFFTASFDFDSFAIRAEITFLIWNFTVALPLYSALFRFRFLFRYLCIERCCCCCVDMCIFLPDSVSPPQILTQLSWLACQIHTHAHIYINVKVLRKKIAAILLKFVYYVGKSSVVASDEYR